jgi:hypothetical protein
MALTHRCHKKEFLLKFKKDRETWIKWIFEAKKALIFKLFYFIFCVGPTLKKQC